MFINMVSSTKIILIAVSAIGEKFFVNESNPPPPKKKKKKKMNK